MDTEQTSSRAIRSNSWHTLIPYKETASYLAMTLVIAVSSSSVHSGEFSGYIGGQEKFFFDEPSKIDGEKIPIFLFPFKNIKR